jgi:hypothetical protein
MMKIIAILSFVSFGVFAEETPAPATSPAPDASAQREQIVNQRQENQEQRIDEGAKSGALNPNEAKRMEKREQQIQKMENKAMADGTMTGKEFRKIERAQNRTSKAIYRNKHNRK